MNVSTTVCLTYSRFDYCLETTGTPPLWGHCLIEVDKGGEDRRELKSASFALRESDVLEVTSSMEDTT